MRTQARRKAHYASLLGTSSPIRVYRPPTRPPTVAARIKPTTEKKEKASGMIVVKDEKVVAAKAKPKPPAPVRGVTGEAFIHIPEPERPVQAEIQRRLAESRRRAEEDIKRWRTRVYMP